MRAWIKSFRALAAATVLFCISEPISVLADALDFWHTNDFGSSGIAYGNGKFVAVNSTSFRISSDGVAWTQYISPPVLNYEGITFGGGVFMAYGNPISTNSDGPRYILESYDGLNWTKVYDTPSKIRGAAYGNGRFVFVGDRIISTTLNPFQWTEFQPPNPVVLDGVTFGAGRFVAVGAQTIAASVLSSTDGIVWRYEYGPKNRENLHNVSYGNGMFVATWRTNYAGAGSYYNGFLTSSNLVYWQSVTLVDSGQPGGLGGITFGGGYFIGAVQNYTYTSTNALDWVDRVAANGTSIIFAFGAGTFLASDNNSRTIQSDVFAPPTNAPPTYLNIAMYSGVTIQGIEGQTYRIEYSTNLAGGSTWMTLTNISLPSSTYLWVDTCSPVVGERFYRAVLIE